LGLQNYWELQTSIDFMVMAVFLGSAYTLRSKGHVAMELFENALPEKARRRLAVIGQLAGFAVCLYRAWVGFQLTAGVFQSGERALGIYQPVLWPRYAAMPVVCFSPHCTWSRLRNLWFESAAAASVDERAADWI
jgi:TRAP-type C4-dicarboxylate transport system permease small subunit